MQEIRDLIGSITEGDIVSTIQLALMIYVFRDRFFGGHSLAKDMGRIEGKVDALIMSKKEGG